MVPAPVTYQPALYDSDGRPVPYDPATWRLDRARGCIDFPWGLPPRLETSAAKPVPFRLSFFVYSGPLGAAPAAKPDLPALTDSRPAIYVSSDAVGADDPRRASVGTGERLLPYESLEQAFAALRGRRTAARIFLVGSRPHRLPPAGEGLPPIAISGRLETVCQGVVASAAQESGGELLILRAEHYMPGAAPGDIVRFTKTLAEALVGEVTMAGEAMSLLLTLAPRGEPHCAAGDPFLVLRPEAKVVLESPAEIGQTAWKNVGFEVPAGAAALRLAAKTGFTRCRFLVSPGAGLLIEGGPIVAGLSLRDWSDPSGTHRARAGIYVSARGAFIRRASPWAPDRLTGCVFDGTTHFHGSCELSAAYFRGAGHRVAFSGGASEVVHTHFRAEPGAGAPLLQADAGAFLYLLAVDVDLPPPEEGGSGSVALYATQRAVVEAERLRIRGAETALEVRAATLRATSSALLDGLGDGAVVSGGSTLDLLAVTVAGCRGRGISAADSTLLFTDTAIRANGADGVDAVNCRVALVCEAGSPHAGAGLVDGNNGAGLRIRSGSAGRLEGLHIANNAGMGLVVDGATNLVWARCVALGNSGGVSVSGCSSLDFSRPHAVSANNAPGESGGVGASVRGASRCRLGPGRVEGHYRAQAEATTQCLVGSESESDEEKARKG